MTPRYIHLMVLMSLLLVLAAVNVNAAVDYGVHAPARKHRFISPHIAASTNRRKVRGRTQRALKGSSGKSSDVVSSSAKSQAYSGSMAASSKKATKQNIFDHTQTTQEKIPVECGSEEQPFLTTFVTSIQFENYASATRKGGKSTSSGKSSKGGKSTSSGKTTAASSSGKSKGKSSSGKSAGKTSAGKSGKSQTSAKKSGSAASSSSSYDPPMTSEDYPYDDDDDLVGEIIPPEEVIVLNETERTILEAIFKDVYNAYTFESCDGFFRTVYTARMVLAEPKPDEEYSVSLARRYRSAYIRRDGNFTNVTGIVSNQTDFGESTEAVENGRQLHERILTTTTTVATNSSTDLNISSSRQGMYPENLGSEAYIHRATRIPSLHPQRVVGGYDQTIYYVVMTATCRNCPVTAEVNFPLLELSEDREHSKSNDEMMTEQPFQVSPLGHDDVCMCPAHHGEEASYRARRRLQERSTLPTPEPDGPTAFEYLQAVNLAIQRRQDETGELTGIIGLSGLIEPDYFNGENPGRVTITAAPTISPMPTVSPAPTATPTISPVPTAPPSISPAPTVSPAPSSSPSTPLPTRRPTSMRPTAPPFTRTPTQPPVSTPVPTASGASSIGMKGAIMVSFSAILPAILIPELFTS